MLQTDDLFLGAFGLVRGGEVQEVVVRGVNGRRMAVFRIAGPDAVSGTYRVFRSTSMETSQVSVESGWEDYPPYSGACNDIPATTHDLLPAEEILPNPLEGFHGPTVANPERLCRVKGGTRLP